MRGDQTMSPGAASAASGPDGTEGRSPEAALFGCPQRGWRRRWFIVIFESDTRAGRNFDLALLVTILASVIVVMLDSLDGLVTDHDQVFTDLEWLFTALFTLEYLARLTCVRRPQRYARSFFGIVDLLAVLPTYLAFLVPGLQALIDVRVLRLLRLFRILKLTAYIREYRMLGRALRASAKKILVFISTVLLIVVLLGTVMYVVEGPASGFTSIPVSIYWAIITITTVGFGDIAPQTAAGRTIASFIMLLGWGILAVPTGIVTAEMAAGRFGDAIRRRPAARHCQNCGAALPDEEPVSHE